MSQICVYSVASLFHKFSSKNLTKLSLYLTIQRLYSTNLRLIQPFSVHKSESISNNSASVFNKPASASKMCDGVKPEPEPPDTGAGVTSEGERQYAVRMLSQTWYMGAYTQTHPVPM